LVGLIAASTGFSNSPLSRRVDGARGDLRPARRRVGRFASADHAVPVTDAVDTVWGGTRSVSDISIGTTLARPFMPARDFDLSKRFYEALGFEKAFDGEVAIFNAGSGGFILQRYFQKDWAANFMMQLVVDDLDAWWSHITSLDLPTHFGVPVPKPPAMQPWGLRIAYVVDPSGVLWHVAQRPENAKRDR
jgi:predicted enzyme related to lactoylglutathione lyase